MRPYEKYNVKYLIESIVLELFTENKNNTAASELILLDTQLKNENIKPTPRFGIAIKPSTNKVLVLYCELSVKLRRLNR